MKHRKITLMALAMSIVLSLSACGSAAETTDADTASVETTESVEETVESESTEAFVSNEDLSIDETETESAEPESTETVEVTSEPVADSAAIDVKTVAAYTYTDLNKTMYAKSTVNVRSLPSTDGDKLGSLSKNQEVTVTGQCNETGWYRIKLNDSDAYVSNKYLSDEPVATAQANKTVSKSSTQSTGDPIADAAIAKFGPNAVVFADGTIFDSTTWQQVGTVNDLDGVDLSNSNITAPNNTATVADGYNRAAAEQVWSLMNAERTAAGLNALTWDEDMYNYACSRAYDIITDFSHNGCFSGYGENILYNFTGTAESIHNQWYDSPGHHANYMGADYGSGACAVYVYNGTTYAVENFALASTDPYANSQYREYNGETLDLSGQQAEAFDNGNFWTASNGIIIYIQSNGNLSCNAIGDEANAAFAEYDATH